MTFLFHNSVTLVGGKRGIDTVLLVLFDRIGVSCNES